MTELALHLQPSSEPIISRFWQGFDDKALPSIHYVLASTAFTIYGTQVCPLLETLRPIHLAVPLFAALFLRFLLINWVNGSPYVNQVVRQFRVDLSLFLASGLALIIYNIEQYGAPWHSNLKVITGMTILGLFVSIDLALARERKNSHTLMHANRVFDRAGRFSSFSKKFGMFALMVLVSISLVLFLVVNHDLNWILSHNNQIITENVRNSVLLEISFVVGVMLVYCMRIIRSYVANLRMYLTFQNEVLSSVLHGDLSKRVPVTSHDEFGLMARGTNAMIESLQDNREEISLTQDVSVLALASLAETRDNETGAHILRTQRYVKVLAVNLSKLPEFKEQLTNVVIDLLYKTAPLHDIGKVGIPDSILLKPEKLNDDEFKIMKQHTQIGANALLAAESQLGSNSFLGFAREIAANHHEKWDGSGYPNQLKGDSIPISARLMALADVYDALISKRIYKPAFSHQKAKRIIVDGSGTHFDPKVVTAFLACELKFIRIAAEFRDSN